MDLQRCFFSTIHFIVLNSILQLSSADVVKTKVQAEPKKYPGMIRAFKKVYRDDGAAGFIQGWLPTFFGFFFWGGTSYALTEFMRRTITGTLSATDAANLEVPIILVAAATGAFIGSFIICPFESIRIRSVSQKDYAPNIFQVAARMVKEEGIPSLFAAVPLFLFKEVPFASTYNFVDTVVKLFFSFTSNNLSVLSHLSMIQQWQNSLCLMSRQLGCMNSFRRQKRTCNSRCWSACWLELWVALQPRLYPIQLVREEIVDPSPLSLLRFAESTIIRCMALTYKLASHSFPTSFRHYHHDRQESQNGDGSRGGRFPCDRTGRGGPAALFTGLPIRSFFYSLVVSLQFLVYDSVRFALGIGSDDLKLYLDVLGGALKESGGPL